MVAQLQITLAASAGRSVGIIGGTSMRRIPREEREAANNDLVARIDQAQSRFGGQGRESPFGATEATILGGASADGIGRLADETPERRLRRAENVGNQPITPEERKLGLERIIGTNDFVSVTFVQQMLGAIRSTGRVVIRSSAGVLGYGTGFLVAPGILLTNNHVIPTEERAGLAMIEFNYEERFGGIVSEEVAFALKPEIFFATDQKLDFTFVAVDAQSTRNTHAIEEFGYLPLNRMLGKVAKGEPVNIVQHPSGERKRIAIRENKITSLTEHHIQYTADTAPGSSGAPVLSDFWEVVALHYTGVPERIDGRIMSTTRGVPWDKATMDETDINWIGNEGVRVSIIVQALENMPLPPHFHDLRDFIVGLGSEPAPDMPMPFETVMAPGNTKSGSPSAGWQANADGTATWIVPVSLTVGVAGLAGPTIGGIQASVSRRGQQAGPPRGHMGDMSSLARQPRPSQGSTAPRHPNADPELQAALAELERARTRPYYEPAAYARERDDYWSGLAPDDNAFRQRLSTHLKSTHSGFVRYDSGRSLYPWIDLQPNLKLKSIYTGEEFDAEAALEAAVAIDRAREAIENDPRELAADKELLLESLEASQPYNCEHVVPQSWYQKREPMRGDLHHLFACESRCNSFRGNFPLIEFDDFEEAVRTGCGKREPSGAVIGFEPKQGKGAVARATLYFLLRYPDELDQTLARMDFDRIANLIVWSNGDPVSEYERHRNQAIFEKQGNRNPFIDHPEWATNSLFGGTSSPSPGRGGRGMRGGNPR
jgi:endonuclease G, mitochondrial